MKNESGDEENSNIMSILVLVCACVDSLDYYNIAVIAFMWHFFSVNIDMAILTTGNKH